MDNKKKVYYKCPNCGYNTNVYDSNCYICNQILKGKEVEKIREQGFNPNLKKENQDLEKEIIEKIKKIVRVSDRLRLNMMRKALKMKEEEFLDKVFDWAEKFEFRIDGDYLVINKDTVSSFIEALDRQFEAWERSKGGKVD